MSRISNLCLTISGSLEVRDLKLISSNILQIRDVPLVVIVEKSWHNSCPEENNGSIKNSF